MRMRAMVTPMVVVLVLLAVSVGYAATVERLGLRELTLNAKSIVVGTVTEVSSAWNESHTQIYTSITVQVDEAMKGTAASEITLSQLGGVVGDIRIDVPGFPVFKTGEELVLFVNNNVDNIIPTIGLGQGKFKVYTDQYTGRKMVVNDVIGLEFVDPVEVADAATISMSLDDLRVNVKRFLATQPNQVNE